MAAQDSPSSEKRTFRVLVLGPFMLDGDGVHEAPSSWSRPARSLFLLVVTAPQLRRGRDEVIDTLWPDAAPEAGAANLRSALYHLRRLLGGGEPSPVLYEGGWISLNSTCDWDIDLVRFDTLVQTAGEDSQALEAAMALYRGEPLPDERYSEWARPVRERLQRSWRDSSVRLARQYRQNGEQDLALAQYERTLEADAYDETALRELLLVLADMGRRAEAVRRYERFVLLLREELDLSPDADTEAAITHVRAARETTLPARRTDGEEGDSDTHLPTGGFLGARPVWPIIGRETNIDRIRAAADGVTDGAGQFILLTGEAGIGKSRLAQEAMLLLQQRGFVVASGRCYRRMQSVVLGPIREVVRGLSRACPAIWNGAIDQWPNLVPLLPDRGMGSALLALQDPAQRHDLEYALTSLLVSIGAQKPVALLLDDLQWADDASLDVLQHLVRETRGNRVLFIGTYRDAGLDRDHPLSTMTRELAREGLVERDVMQRFTIEDTGKMIAVVLGDIDWAEEFIDFTHRRTKGNPFFVNRMLQSLGGRYRLIRQIGIGGMGRVFEAIDLRTGEHVAAKLMFARAEADPKALQRFQQEGGVLAALKHPNIVEVHGTFLDEHASCIVMELLHGLSLKESMRERRLDLPRVKALGQQVAAALSFAHDHGVVHRDVKPDNIMLLNEDQVKVTDFGIARLLRSSEAVTTMTSLGMTMGTPHYMAPEQILGQRVDGRADIYSMGAVLYELVTGRPPFEGDEPMAIAVQHVQAPAPPSDFNAELPQGWDAVILKALAKKPTDRYQSAQLMSEGIASLSVPEPVSDTGSESSQTSLSRLRRRPRIMGGVGVAAIALLATMAVLYATVWHGSSSGPPISAASGIRLPTASFGVDQSRAVQFSQLAGIAIGRTGDVYATDVGNSRVDMLTPTGRLAGQWPLGRRGTTVEGGDTYEIVGPSGTIVDAHGNVFVADYSYHRIQRLRAGAKSFVGWGAPGAAPGPYFGATGLAGDNAGNIYSVDAFNDRIYKLSRTGEVLRQWGVRGSGFGQLESPGGIAVDSHHMVYVVDTGNDRIQKYSDRGVPLAVWGSSGSRPGEFVSPEGVTVDKQGNIYVADTGNNRVQKLSPTGKPLKQWATKGCDPRRIPQPVDVKIDGYGNIYVADGTSQCIQKLSPGGHLLQQWGQQSSSPGQLKSPENATVDARGNVYVADTGHDRVQVFSPRGKPLTAWGTTGARSGQLRSPSGIARDGNGNLYVADTGNNRILIMSAAGKILKPFGSQPTQLKNPFSPTGLTLDGNGNVLVSDWGNGRVIKFSTSGHQLATWGSEGSGPGQLLHPGGISLDARGNIYVADEGNHRIQEISTTGSVRTWNRSGSRRARLSAPVGLVVDTRGHLYVADAATSRITEFSLTGSLIAQWGSEGAGNGQFRGPRGLTMDAAGNLYVADAGNNRIQKFDPVD